VPQVRSLNLGLGVAAFLQALTARSNAINIPIVRITTRYNYSLDFIPISCILTVFLHFAAEKRQGVPCPPKSLARFSPALNSPHP
jgi:hypothetical protein